MNNILKVGFMLNKIFKVGFMLSNTMDAS
jgi:hypothetical protein